MASSKHMLSREDVPMWLWAEEFAGPESFIDLPPDFSWDSLPVEEKPLVEAKEPKQNKPIFYYSRITTQHCIDSDLAFCEGVAIAYSRILQDKSEKIFLRGNKFLAKLAKAVFEQNGNLFAETCMKCKDEKYFRECAEELNNLDFVIEKDGKIDKKSWLDLYDIVLVLTEEYVTTKCKLPKVGAVECKENSDNADKMEIIIVQQSAGEKDIESAVLVPIERNGLEDSSDKVTIGELFFKFLNENFPFKNSKEELVSLMSYIYGDEVCEDLDWLCEDAAKDSLPLPEINIDAMEQEDMLGSHDGDSISINQRLVLDAISSRSPNDCFVLFTTMLIEYGHFLGHILDSKAGKQTDNAEKAGRAFAYSFMEYSAADLFNKDFDFADFTAPDVKSKEQKFTVKVSGLNSEQRKTAFYSLGAENLWEGLENV